MTRAVILGGRRTPFVKAFGEYVELDTIALGAIALRHTLSALELQPQGIDAIVWGGVVLPPGAVNVGREIALQVGLPASVEAHTVTRACASGLQAVTTAVAMVERGEAEVVIAGGSDSTSNAPIPLPAAFMRKMGPLVMGKRSGAGDWLRAVAGLSLIRDVIPAMPRVAERSTGETMGESAERMAERNAISRESQDEFALRSHLRAAQAHGTGRFASEICPVDLPNGETLRRDSLVRADTSLERLAKLRPAFKRGGTITAGNASPLTDGAAALVVMSEQKARALGYSTFARLRSVAYVGVDPRDQLLIGPALAVPKALDRAGLALQDIALVDMHEAFAAQCLSVLKALGSRAFARERLGRDAPVGEIPAEKLNVWGGSLSLGHPFGATGVRMVTTMVNELSLRREALALVTLCAAGGLGAAAVLEAG